MIGLKRSQIMILLLVMIFFKMSLSESNKNKKQNDYTVKIIRESNNKNDEIFLKCIKSISCAIRFKQTNPNNNNMDIYYQLEEHKNQLILIKRDNSQFYDIVIDSIIKQDEFYNYVQFKIDQSYIQIQKEQEQYTIEISSVYKNDNDNELINYHFQNLFDIYKVQVIQKQNNYIDEEYHLFQKLNTIIPFIQKIQELSNDNNTQEEQINLNQNQQQRLLQTATTNTDVVFTLIQKAHAIGLLVIWGFLVDFSIICVRYCKAYKKYLRFHASIFAVCNICSLIVIFFQISKRTTEIDNIDKQSSKERSHFGIGIAMVVIMILQHLIGMVTKLNFENENGSEKVHYIKLVHKVLGYSLYILGKINVIVGADFFERKYYYKTVNEDYWWAKAIGGLYAIQLIILASIEFIYRQEPEFLIRKKPNTKEYQDLQKQSMHNAILEKLNNHVPVQQINRLFPDILYCVHENSVYDITEIQHPGGQFILKHIKGKEISRYFNGGYACEQTTMQAYRHTLYAQNFLKQFHIGDINNEYYNIFLPNPNNEQLKTHYMPKDVWGLDEVRSVNDIYKVFLFNNPNYTLKTHLSGVRWFGRSVVLRPQLDTLNIHPRNYSVVMAYVEENYRYRIELIKYFQNKMRDDLGMSQMSQIRTYNPPEHPILTTKLPLLIKKELRNTKNGLSKFMHLEVHKYFYITEPIGHGLELDEHSDGEHVIFASGTGILPFLDLFDYLLKKLIYVIINERFGQREAQLVNPHNEKYESTFGPDFRIKLYAAFNSKAECYGYQIISDLHTFCLEFQIPWFSAVVRFANSESDHFLPSTKSYFDSQFIDLALSQTFPTKFLICGPPEFNKNIFNILTCFRGIDEQRVQII